MAALLSTSGFRRWSFGTPRSLPRNSNLLLVELFALLVELPARHVARLALRHRDDDVAVKRPGVLAVVFARPRGVVGVAVVKAQDQLTALAGAALGVHEL